MRYPSVVLTLWPVMFMGAGLAACSDTVAEADTMPLRIVRAGKADVPGLKKFIDLSYGACLVSKGQAPRPAPALPEAVLANLVTHEEEELFDGKRWAKYEVYRAIGADPANQCQPVVFHARSVDIETTCESSLRGTAATLTELLDPEAQPPAPDLQQGGADNPECSAPRPPQPPAGARPVDAGQGVSCIWNGDLVTRGAGGRAGSDPGSSDICLYSKRPFYYVKGYGRPVMLQTRSDDRSLTGANLAAFAGQIAGFGNVKLVSFSEGQRIAADRFSRAAAESFLRQPTKTPIGSAR